MPNVQSIDFAKNQASKIRDRLSTLGYKISLRHSLEAAAAANNFPDWNHYSAHLKGFSSEQPIDAISKKVDLFPAPDVETLKFENYSNSINGRFLFIVDLFKGANKGHESLFISSVIAERLGYESSIRLENIINYAKKDPNRIPEDQMVTFKECDNFSSLFLCSAAWLKHGIGNPFESISVENNGLLRDGKFRKGNPKPKIDIVYSVNRPLLIVSSNSLYNFSLDFRNPHLKIYDKDDCDDVKNIFNKLNKIIDLYANDEFLVESFCLENNEFDATCSGYVHPKTVLKAQKLSNWAKHYLNGDSDKNCFSGFFDICENHKQLKEIPNHNVQPKQPDNENKVFENLCDSFVKHVTPAINDLKSIRNPSPSEVNYSIQYYADYGNFCKLQKNEHVTKESKRTMENFLKSLCNFDPSEAVHLESRFGFIAAYLKQNMLGDNQEL